MMAQTCLPPDTDTGTLSADNATCAYPGGQMVMFTPAVVIPTPDDPAWNFTITDAGGAPCLHFEDVGALGFKLVVNGSQTVTVSATASLSEVITCPDGKSYQTSNAIDLLTCPGGGLVPGFAWASSPQPTDPPFISAGLSGTGDVTLSLFACDRPAN